MKVVDRRASAVTIGWSDFEIDAHRVGSKLWVGSCPILWGIEAPLTIPEILKARGFDLVVLCAEELQELPLGVPMLKVPLDDHEITIGEYRRALRAASLITKRRKQNERILVTCQMGVNRSSLVAAMSLMLHERLTAKQAIEQIQERRKPAIRMQPLVNKSFVGALHKLDGLIARSRPTVRP